MTALILYGFNDPHAIALVEELRFQDRSLELHHSEPGLDDEFRVAKRDEIALVWCLGSSLAFPVAVSNEIASRGKPVVAIADESLAEMFDFNSGFIELCFNYPNVNELKARIRTVKARSTIHTEPVIVHGDLTIDVDSFEVTLGDRSIELTYKEYELLKLFASNPGRVFRREDILNRIWGDDYIGGTRTVDVHVRRLRSKLDDVSHSIIETMWRVGYRFSTPDGHAKSKNGGIREPVSVG